MFPLGCVLFIPEPAPHCQKYRSYVISMILIWYTRLPNSILSIYNDHSYPYQQTEMTRARECVVNKILYIYLNPKWSDRLQTTHTHSMFQQYNNTLLCTIYDTQTPLNHLNMLATSCEGVSINMDDMRDCTCSYTCQTCTLHVNIMCYQFTSCWMS